MWPFQKAPKNLMYCTKEISLVLTSIVAVLSITMSHNKYNKRREKLHKL